MDEPGTLGEGEVLVRMKFSSVQPLDTAMYDGELPHLSYPQVLGTDGIGVVERSECDAFPVGTQVAFVFRRPLEDFGAWSSLVRLDAKRACLAALPYDVAPQMGASGLTSTVLATACLRHFRRGSVIIVPGVAGAVGLAVAQLAAVKGMQAIGLVRGPLRVARLHQEFGAIQKDVHELEFGASNKMSFIDVTSPNWVSQVLHLCDADAAGVVGADGVVDGIGGDALLQLLQEVVRPHGHLVTYGARAGAPDPAAFKSAVESKCLFHHKEGVTEILARRDAETHFQGGLRFMGVGRYRPPCWEVVSWQHARECLVPQAEWSDFLYASQLTEGRIGRILLKFD